MTECKLALLSDRGAVRVSGKDARHFLQGLITNDLEKAQEGRAVHAGLLTPQGKILFDFFLVPAAGGFLLDVAAAKAGELVLRLGFYKLRAQVEIEEEPSLKVAAIWNGQPEIPLGVIAYADPRLAELGMRLLVPGVQDLDGFGCVSVGEADYHARRIGLGVPEGGRDYAFGETFPQEALFDWLNGVDFQKGCFVGQEVVSRMEHRGTARSRIVGIEGEASLPETGAPISAGEQKIGSLGSVDGRRGLALLRLDRAEAAWAEGRRLFAGDVPVELRMQNFAKPRASAPAPS